MSDQRNPTFGSPAQAQRPKKIAPFTKKDVFSRRKHNELVAAINPLLALAGVGCRFVWSDANVLCLIDALQSGTGSGSGNVNYRGEYSSANDYAVLDLVYVGTAATRFVYICEIANTHVAPQAPTVGETGTIYWRLIGSHVTGQARFKIHSISDLDYVVGYMSTGTYSGGTEVFIETAVNIAKHEFLRPSLGTETVDSVIYTYSAQTDNSRSVSGNDGSSESQVMYPRYKTGGIIYAIKPEGGTGITSVDWLEVSPSRGWSLLYGSLTP